MIWASFGAKGPEHFAVIESTTISGGVMQQDNVITEWLKEKNQGVAMIQTSMNYIIDIKKIILFKILPQLSEKSLSVQ